MADVRTILANTVKYGVPVAVAVAIILSVNNCSNVNGIKAENESRDSVAVKTANRLDSLILGVDTLKQRIDGVEEFVWSVEDRVEDVEKRVDVLEQRVDTIKSCHCSDVPKVKAPVKQNDDKKDVVKPRQNAKKPKQEQPVVEKDDKNASVRGVTVVIDNGSENSGNIVVGNNNNTVNGETVTVIINQPEPQEKAVEASISVCRVIRRERTR